MGFFFVDLWCVCIFVFFVLGGVRGGGASAWFPRPPALIIDWVYCNVGVAEFI